MSVSRSVVAGLIGGAVAAGSMSLVHRAVAGLGAGSPQHHTAPRDNEDEDATVKVADGIVRWLAHRPLSETEKPLAGHLVHYAFGAGVGALYGGVAAAVPQVTAAAGLPFGVAVWLGAHAITVPMLGLADPPTRRPLSKEGPEFVMHLVYGVVTELVRRLARQAM